MPRVSTGGGESGISTTSTLTGGQSDLLEQVLKRLSTMISEGTGVGPAGVIGAAEGGLTEALAGLSPEFMGDYFRENVAPSMTRTFEEDVIPQLREEMISTGDFWGTPRVDVIADARQKQAERMQAQMSDWMRWGREQGTAALPYVPSIAGVGQGLEMERLGATQPFINTPTELAIGEPSGNRALEEALASIASGTGGGMSGGASGGGVGRSGGGAGSGGGYGTGGSLPGTTGSPGQTRPLADGGSGSGGGRGESGPVGPGLPLLPLAGGDPGEWSLPSGGAGFMEPLSGELPGIGEGTMYDRPETFRPGTGTARWSTLYGKTPGEVAALSGSGTGIFEMRRDWAPNL